MIPTLLISLGALSPVSLEAEPVNPAAVVTPLQEEAQDPRSRYAQAASARDAQALRALFTEQPGLILFLFDGDLEGSLSVWEDAAGEPDPEALARIAELHGRALFAARMATEVTGRPIFVDYATSFVGWNDEQKRSFRGGQKAFGQAREALQGQNFERALAHAVECRERAMPLGDWWGSAMGLDAEANALAALDRMDEALMAASQARLLWNQLGLAGNEIRSLLLMADASETLERPHRAHASVVAALALMKADDPNRAAVEAHRDALAEQLGSQGE
ncbi:MAG: hypothetical protein AAFZ65_18310 [Planctomycetota bacterium]